MKKRFFLQLLVSFLLLALPVFAAETSTDPYFKYMVGIAVVLLLIVFLVNPRRRRQRTIQLDSSVNEAPRTKEEIQPSVEQVKNNEVKKIYNEENIYVVNPEGEQGYRKHSVAVREEDI